MKLYPVKLLTVTCEILAQKNIIDILKKHQITGYTTYEVDGNGARGLRGQGFKNEKNVKVEVVLQEEKLSMVDPAVLVMGGHPAIKCIIHRARIPRTGTIALRQFIFVLDGVTHCPDAYLTKISP